MESPEILFHLYHQFKPIPHSRQHSLEEHSLSYRGLMASAQTGVWTHLSKPVFPNHLPQSLISQQILSPPHPPAPCYLLAAFVPNCLHERLTGSNSREIVLLKTCHFPQKMLSEVLKMLLSISCSFYSNNRNSLLPSHALVSWRKFK